MTRAKVFGQASTLHDVQDAETSAQCGGVAGAVRSRLTLELELVALRHQLTVLRRQHPGLHRRYKRRAA